MASRSTPRPSAGPTREARLEIRGARAYQRAFILCTALNVAVVSATQVGKTWACAAWIVMRAWCNPGTTWGWFAPTEKQLKTGFKAVVAILAAAGILAGKTESSGDRSARVTNGAEITFASWHDPETLRGQTIHGGVVDEAGLLTQQASAIISSRRSETMGPLRYIGNPGLTTGPFRAICSRGLDKDSDPEADQTFVWTWRDRANAKACPCGLPNVASDELADPAPHQGGCERREYLAFIEHERLTLPEIEYERLYEAKWTADEGTVFREGCIDAKTIGEPWTKPREGRRYLIAVDVAQEVDWLVATVWDEKTLRLGAMERWRGVPYPESGRRLKAIAAFWNGAEVWVEDNGPGIALADILDDLGGVSCFRWTTGANKEHAVLGFARDLHDPASEMTLAPLPPLQDELKVFRATRMPKGSYRYEAPSGMHDDCTMSAVIGRAVLMSPEQHRGWRQWLEQEAAKARGGTA